MLEYLDQAKSMYKNAKNSILKIPEMEAKVLEATSSEAWGASSTQMREIARATHSYANFPIIMDTLWRRIDDEPKNWRHILKGLILLDFLVKNGSEQCVREARVHLMQVQRLYDFTFVEGDKDYGLTIREKSRQLSDLINDDDRIAEEREKARVTASKFSEAISSDTYHPGHGSSYGGRSGGGEYGRDSYDRGYDRGGRGEYDRGGRDYDRGRDRDYGRDDEYRRRDDYQDARSPQPAPRGHIRAPSGGGSAPAPAPAPAAAKPPVDFFDLMDEPKKAAPAQQPSTDFFDAFPESKAAPPAAAPASAPANDFFSATPGAAPLAPTNQEPDEWADFAKVEAEDTKNPWSNKKLFDLDNLATPTATSASSGNKLGALGATTTSPTRPLGATTSPLGAAPLGGGAPLGAGRGFVPTATPLGAPLGAPLGVGAPVVAPALGRGVPVAAPLGVTPAGYAVAAPGLAYPAGYAAAPYGAVPMAYPAAPVAYGVAPAGYAVAPGVGVGLRPGVPAQPGFGPK